jgi:alpha-glucosidase
MKICTKAFAVTEENGFYCIRTDSVPLKLWFLTDSIIRIRACFTEPYRELSYSLVMESWNDDTDSLFSAERRKKSPELASVSENEHEFVLTGHNLRILISKETCCIRITDFNGNILHSDLVDKSYYEDANKRRVHTGEIASGDIFYGFGEKTGVLNKSQFRMTMSPSDAMGYNPEKTDSLYKHIPFFIKLNGDTQIASGYFYHNTYEAVFDMGCSHSNYWKKHFSYITDGGDIDLFFIAGPTIKDVVRRYTDLTGKSVLLPVYALGYLGSSMYYPELPEKCDEAILNFIDTAKEKKVPIDGFQLSSGYCVDEKTKKRCVFIWNKRRFNDPDRFFNEMKKRGITVSPNIKPGLLLSHPFLSELQKERIFVRSASGEEDAIGTWWGGKGVFADFTNPDTRRIWKLLLKKNILSHGTVSVWNDNCEYDSIVDLDSRIALEGKGGTIGEGRTVMANIMCALTYEAIKEEHPDLRPFVVCRAGHSGIQRYAQTWAGDNYTSWDALKYNVPTILGMGLSGVANNGCDIGGFYGPAPDAQLLIRWVQNGIFQPRFSIHSTNTDNTVTEPWMYSDYAGLIARTIAFRYRMIPYLYSLMYEASVTGLPIMRALALEFQNDSAVFEESFTFMEGSSLLVANVLEKDASVRNIYFPQGSIFYDFYTRKSFRGGTAVSVPVTLDSIPLYIRSGAIIPLTDNEITNLMTEKYSSLHIIAAPAENGQFTLYEDDGVTSACLLGEFKKTVITMTAGERVRFEFISEGSYVSPVKTVLLDVISETRAPFYVVCDGNELVHYLDRAKFENAESGWYYSQSKKSVLVRYPCPQENYEVIISFEQFDLLGM